jgi:hypothetical protein
MRDGMVDGITVIIKALSPAQRRRLARRLIEEHVFSEDEEDVLLFETRKHESSRPYSEIRTELVRKGKLR